MDELDSHGPRALLRTMEDLVARSSKVLEDGVRLVTVARFIEGRRWILGEVSFAEARAVQLWVSVLTLS